MVDAANLNRAMTLDGERVAIELALHLLDGDGKIQSMTISGKLDTVTVPTSYMPYPQQMVTSIRSLFDTRLAAISKELADLGVTGL